MANNHKAVCAARRLFRDRRGISSVEFALVCSLFFMLVLGVVDFSRAMWEWNAAAKATHWGVRYAIVNDMVSKKMTGFSGVLAGLDAGSAIDPSVVATDLGTVTFTCNNSGCNGNGDIATSFDNVAFDLIVAQMQMIYSRIGPENVVVEYRHVGLGIAGDPTSPDLHPLVTVSLRNMTFDFVTPGLSGIFTLAMPDYAASMTGEDLTTL